MNWLDEMSEEDRNWLVEGIISADHHIRPMVEEVNDTPYYGCGYYQSVDAMVVTHDVDGHEVITRGHLFEMKDWVGLCEARDYCPCFQGGECN